MKKRIIKWFDPKKFTGWEKDMPPEQRRALMLKSHKNNLSAARSCQALANVTKDRKTKRAASMDADYFYEQHKLEKRHPVRIINVVPPITPRTPRLR